MRFKNIFGTYLCSQSTLVSEVQPYLFAFTSAKFGAVLPFLGFLGLFLGFGSGSKTGSFGAIFGDGVRLKSIFET